MAQIKFTKPGEPSIKKSKPVGTKLKRYIKILSVISIIEVGIIVYGVMKYVHK
jgi:hypothetical protein